MFKESVLPRSRTLFLMSLLALSSLFTSCGEESKRNPVIQGVEGPLLEVANDGLLITLVLENIQLDGGLRYPIPEYDNSYIEVGPHLNSGGTLMAVHVSFLDVFDNGDFLRQLEPNRLPGGRAIPGVTSGQLPSIAFSIPELDNLGFYLGEEIFGLWIPIDLGVDSAIATFRFYSGKTRAGNISLVGRDANGENGGLFLALLLDTKAAKIVERRR